MGTQPYTLRAVSAFAVEVTTPKSTTHITLEDLVRAVKFHDREPRLREHFHGMLDEASKLCRQWRRERGR